MMEVYVVELKRLVPVCSLARRKHVQLTNAAPFHRAHMPHIYTQD